MTSATAADFSDDTKARANVRRLAAAQAMTGANTAVIYATGSIVGATLAPDVALATLPISIYVLGQAVGTLPTGAISRLYGRRVAFLIGAGCGALCGVLACLAIFGGTYGAVAQSYRFAATDGASPAYRPKAISLVLAGGIFAGLLGPQLVQWTMDFWQPYLFAASFVVQTGVALVAIAVLSGVHAPKPPATDFHGGRPLFEVVRQPRFIAAVVCGTVSYTMMNFMMTSAPLAMKFCGLPIGASNFGIQWHIVAMYGPSFFTGALIVRFGAPAMVAVGLGLEALAAAIGLSGITPMHFWAALIVMGLGWNFGFIGASALVVETHRPQERNKVQAFNDFLVFGTMALTSFASGHVLASHGWAVVNLLIFPPVAVALICVALLVLHRRRTARTGF